MMRKLITYNGETIEIVVELNKSVNAGGRGVHLIKGEIVGSDCSPIISEAFTANVIKNIGNVETLCKDLIKATHDEVELIEILKADGFL